MGSNYKRSNEEGCLMRLVSGMVMPQQQCPEWQQRQQAGTPIDMAAPDAITGVMRGSG